MADSIKIKIDGDDSGFKKSLSGLGGVAKKGLGVALKGIAAGAAAGTAAIVTLGTQAVKSYAQWEQLSGGAKLLFGDAYGYIEEQAKNAFQTVQMSTNDYLQQVNGFSTGLKTALGGNEQAAAELAHKIVVAEADIVAATGNTAENVQNAFNGIMKSNFTMLDNLQLGITPTKEGFQQVIDKVNEWNSANGKATKYQISNLADCQSALIDYIEMQGLSGYAAKEASGTIQGSLAMVKSSWENLLTGMANKNADIDSLMDKFIDSLMTVGDNLLPVIETALDGVGEFITTAASELIPKIINVLVSTLPALVSAGAEVLEAFVMGLSQNSRRIAQAATDIMLTLVNTFIELIPMIISVVSEFVAAFAKELGNAVPMLKPLTDIIALLAQNLDVLLPTIIGVTVAIGAFKIAGAASSLITVLTSSVKALNIAMSSNPIGAVIAAVIALIGVTGSLIKAVNKETKEERDYRLAIESTSKAISKNREEMQQRQKAMAEEASAVESSFAHTKRLATELLNLADAEGNVGEANRARAEFILGELNSALGTEYKMVDGQIQKMHELEQSIYDVIKAKKAEALEAVARKYYEEALGKEAELKQNYAKAYADYTDIEHLILQQKALIKNLDEAKAAVARFKEENLAPDPGDFDGYKAWEEHLIRLNQAVTTADNNLKIFNSTNDNSSRIEAVTKNLSEAEIAMRNGASATYLYEDAMAALASGNFDLATQKFKEYTEQAYNASQGTKAFQEGTKEHLASLGQSIQGQLQLYKAALEEYNQSGSESAKTASQAILEDLLSAVNEYKAVGGKLYGGVIDGFNSEGEVTSVELGTLLGDIGALEKEAESLGMVFNDAYASSIIRGKPIVGNAATEVKQEAETKLGDVDGKPPADKLLNDYTGQIRAKASEPGEASAEVAQNAKANMNVDTSPEGTAVVDTFTGGITAAGGQAPATAGAVAQSTKASMNVDTTPEGIAAVTTFSSGVSSQAGTVSSAISSMVQTSTQGFTSVDTNSLGVEFANGFVTGISSQSGAASSAGANIAKSAVSGTKTVTAFASGVFFGQGYVIGINSQASAAYQAGYNLGKQAAQGTKDAQQEGSPSKLMKKSGVFFSQGFVIGIRSGAKDVKKAGGYIAKTAIDSVEKPLKIHSPSVYARDDIGKMFTKGIAIGIKAGKYEVSEATQLLFDELQLQRDLDAISEEEYYERLEFLRDEYITQGTKEWWDYTKELITHAKETREALGNEMLETFEEFTSKASEAYETLADIATEKLDEVMDKQKDFADSLRDMSGGLVKESNKLDEWGNELPGYELTDYNEKAAFIEAYGNTLENTSKRLKDAFGEDVAGYTAFMQQIRDGGLEDGLQAAWLLQQKSDEELKEYIQGYQKFNNLVGSEAQSQYADEVEAVKRMWTAGTEGLAEEFLKEFGELPEGFFDLGTTCAEKFGEAYSKELHSILDNVLVSVSNSMGLVGMKFADAGNPNTTSVSYQPSYYIYATEKASAHEIIKAAKDKEVWAKMEGGY